MQGFAQLPRPLGVLLLLGHTDTGQFGVRMSFSQLGDKKHLQPQTGLKSLAVFGDRAGHTESCQLTPRRAGMEAAGPEVCLALSQAAVLATAED